MRRRQPSSVWAQRPDARESPHANQLFYEIFLAPNAEHRLATCIHHATGERTHWEVPIDFSLDPAAAPAPRRRRRAARASEPSG
jgi:hypothetical protein